jgi:hypothetical protein
VKRLHVVENIVLGGRGWDLVVSPGRGLSASPQPSHACRGALASR